MTRYVLRTAGREHTLWAFDDQAAIGMSTDVLAQYLAPAITGDLSEVGRYDERHVAAVRKEAR